MVDELRRIIRGAITAPPTRPVTASEFQRLAQEHGSAAAALRVLLELAQQSGQPFLVHLALPNGASQQLYGSPRGWLTETATDPSGAFSADGPLILEECRGILIRWEKKAANYLGLIKLACILLWHRRAHQLAAAG